MKVNNIHYRTVWMDGGNVKMIDQTLLPHTFEIITLPTHLETSRAIKEMKVRGAGAIGSTAGYALAQAALEAPTSGFLDYVKNARQTIGSTRPTAQNLFYATSRVFAAIQSLPPEEAKQHAVQEAQAIADEDVESCKQIGIHGSPLIQSGYRVGTHCNAGWLAFTDWGSALSPIYVAVGEGKDVFVYADETRPRTQGSLTAWELQNMNIPHKIITDNSTGFLMQRKEMDMMIVGADRIAANGDTANKIGTYEKAVCAKENNIPFYVAAPTSTIDFSLPDGSQIPIEERSQDEVLFAEGITSSGKREKVRLYSPNTQVRNIAFDITPAKFITGIITENGLFDPGKLKKQRHQQI